MARAAADNLGTHTMDTEKRYTLIYKGDLQPEVITDPDTRFMPVGVGEAIEHLAVGESYTDPDGDTWERIA